MDFKTSVKTCFRKYAVFEGRAARPEFWWFALFGFLGRLVIGTLDRVLFGGFMRGYGMYGPGMHGHGMYGYGFHGPAILATIFSLAILLPSLAVGARRLHDIGRSGWWMLLWFIPVVGWLVLLYWFIQPGPGGSNAYGPAPKR